MTHQPSPTEDVRAEGAGLVPSAGRSGASSEPNHPTWKLMTMRQAGFESNDPKLAWFSPESGCEQETGGPFWVFERWADDTTAAASDSLLAACAPFADARIPEFCSDDSVVAHNSACELFLTAGQVRAIKAAMGKATGGAT